MRGTVRLRSGGGPDANETWRTLVGDLAANRALAADLQAGSYAHRLAGDRQGSSAQLNLRRILAISSPCNLVLQSQTSSSVVFLLNSEGGKD